MGNIFDFLINQPLGWVLKVCYDFTKSYGFAITLFTVFIKLLLVPLGVHQQKGILRQIRIKPKEDLIRKKYAQNKEVLNQKIMDLYKREGYNPVGGCLPMLIQLPIIWSLYSIINRPLTYIQKLSADTISTVAKALTDGGVVLKASAGSNQIPISKALAEHSDILASLTSSGVLSKDFHPISFNFFGLNLSDSPSINHINLLLLIPILSAVTAYLSGLIGQKASTYTSAGNANSTMKTMLIFSPLMSLFITFGLPAGVGLYWTVSNILMMAQSYALNIIYDPAKAAEKAKEEIRRAVEQRRQRKATIASKKSSEIEQRKLDEKNMRRKKAGLPPLESLDGSARDDEGTEDETVEETTENPEDSEEQ